MPAEVGCTASSFSTSRTQSHPRPLSQSFTSFFFRLVSISSVLKSFLRSTPSVIYKSICQSTPSVFLHSLCRSVSLVISTSHQSVKFGSVYRGVSRAKCLRLSRTGCVHFRSRRSIRLVFIGICIALFGHPRSTRSSLNLRGTRVSAV